VTGTRCSKTPFDYFGTPSIVGRSPLPPASGDLPGRAVAPATGTYGKITRMEDGG
jgi:hypothetical protein